MAGVGQIATLSAVSVIVLTPGLGDCTLTEAFAGLAAAAPPVIVVDGIQLDALSASTCHELIAENIRLRRGGRHLIVVNAPAQDVIRLRELGVDAATTTDRVFVDDPAEHPDRDAVAASFARS